MKYCFCVEYSSKFTLAKLGVAMGLLLMLSAFQATEEFIKTEIYEGVTVKLPNSFHPMSEMALRRSYQSARPPLAAYTGEDEQVIFGMNTSNTQWQVKDLQMLQNFYRSSILELYDEVKFMQDSLVTVQGQPFAIFEFIGTVRGEEGALTSQAPLRNYVYVQYTIDKEKTYVFDFTCPARQQSQWQETAHIIMGSVTLK